MKRIREVKAAAVEEGEGDGLEITCIGQLYHGRWQKKYWSCSRGKDRYPYPVGYKAARCHGSHIYHMEVQEGARGPAFLVTSEEGITCLAETANAAWEQIQKRRHFRSKRKKENQPRCDGSQLFGFTNPIVQRLLRELVASQDGVAEQSSKVNTGDIECFEQTTTKQNKKQESQLTDLLPSMLRKFDQAKQELLPEEKREVIYKSLYPDCGKLYSLNTLHSGSYVGGEIAQMNKFELHGALCWRSSQSVPIRKSRTSVLRIERQFANTTVLEGNHLSMQPTDGVSFPACINSGGANVKETETNHGKGRCCQTAALQTFNTQEPIQTGRKRLKLQKFNRKIDGEPTTSGMTYEETCVLIPDSLDMLGKQVIGNELINEKAETINASHVSDSMSLDSDNTGIHAVINETRRPDLDYDSLQFAIVPDSFEGSGGEVVGDKIQKNSTSSQKYPCSGNEKIIKSGTPHNDFCNQGSILNEHLLKQNEETVLNLSVNALLPIAEGTIERQVNNSICLLPSTFDYIVESQFCSDAQLFLGEKKGNTSTQDNMLKSDAIVPDSFDTNFASEVIHEKKDDSNMQLLVVGGCRHSHHGNHQEIISNCPDNLSPEILFQKKPWSKDFLPSVSTEPQCASTAILVTDDRKNHKNEAQLTMNNGNCDQEKSILISSAEMPSRLKETDFIDAIMLQNNVVVADSLENQLESTQKVTEINSELNCLVRHKGGPNHLTSELQVAMVECSKNHSDLHDGNQLITYSTSQSSQGEIDKGESDSLGHELTKSMITLLLPQAVPLLERKTYKRRSRFVSPIILPSKQEDECTYVNVVQKKIMGSIPDNGLQSSSSGSDSHVCDVNLEFLENTSNIKNNTSKESPENLCVTLKHEIQSKPAATGSTGKISFSMLGCKEMEHTRAFIIPNQCISPTEDEFLVHHELEEDVDNHERKSENLIHSSIPFQTTEHDGKRDEDTPAPHLQISVSPKVHIRKDCMVNNVKYDNELSDQVNRDQLNEPEENEVHFGDVLQIAIADKPLVKELCTDMQCIENTSDSVSYSEVGDLEKAMSFVVENNHNVAEASSTEFNIVKDASDIVVMFGKTPVCNSLCNPMDGEASVTCAQASVTCAQNEGGCAIEGITETAAKSLQHLEVGYRTGTILEDNIHLKEEQQIKAVDIQLDAESSECKDLYRTNQADATCFSTYNSLASCNWSTDHGNSRTSLKISINLSKTRNVLLNNDTHTNVGNSPTTHLSDGDRADGCAKQHDMLPENAVGPEEQLSMQMRAQLNEPCFDHVVHLNPVCCFEHQMPVVAMTMNIQVERMQICICCGISDGNSRILFLYELLRQQMEELNPLLLGVINASVLDVAGGNKLLLEENGIQYTSDGKILILLECFMMLNQRESTTVGASMGSLAEEKKSYYADYRKGNGVYLVSVTKDNLCVETRLTAEKELYCLLVPEPDVLIAAGKSGFAICWIMASDWRSCKKSFLLPDLVTEGSHLADIVQLVAIPSFHNMIIGRDIYDTIVIWDRERCTAVFSFHFPFELLFNIHILDIAPVKQQLEAAFIFDKDTDIQYGEHSDDQLGIPVLCFLFKTLLNDNDETANKHGENKLTTWSLACVEEDGRVANFALNQNFKRISAVAVSHDFGAAGTTDGHIYIWEPLTGRIKSKINFFEGVSVSCLLVNSSFMVLAVALTDARVVIYVE